MQAPRPHGQRRRETGFHLVAVLSRWDDLVVDDVDPEQRIAELERRLAQPRAVADPGARHHQLNPTQVHNVSFCKPRLFKRGYDEDEVDTFLERVEATLRDPTARGAVTSADLHDVSFSKPPIGKRGYDGVEVDAFLERVEAALRDPTARGAVTSADLHDVTFSKPPIGKRGYDEDEVDAFLDFLTIEFNRGSSGRGG